MASKFYKQQLALLLDLLPEVDKEKCFALHGGTAINLFIRDMPRLSVDIDLTYIYFDNRENSLQHINESLDRIKTGFRKILPQARVTLETDSLKLFVSYKGAEVKVEVNQINRGTLHRPEQLLLCEKAQEEFDTFCTIQVVSNGQLFGGKICAALDRQHPRDMFDIRYFLNHYEIDANIKEGILLCLLSSSRPIHELLDPHFLDQKHALESQFQGMSYSTFTYEDYEKTRRELIESIHANFNDNDRRFIYSFQSLKPDWDYYDFSYFPSIKWKLQNLHKLYDNQISRYQQELSKLKSVLGI